PQSSLFRVCSAGNDRPDFLPEDDAAKVVGLEQVEYDNRHLIVLAHRESGRIHDREPLEQGFLVGNLVVPFGLRMFLRIAVVNAVDLGGLENDFGADFVGAQRGGRVGREERVARAAAEDDHASFFQVAHRAAANKWLGDLRHRDGALHASGDAEFFEGILEGQRVDYGGQHAHVIARGPLDAARAAGEAAVNVPAANDNDHLHAQFPDLLNLQGHVAHGSGTDPDAALAAQGFAAELEEDSMVLGTLCHGRCGSTRGRGHRQTTCLAPEEAAFWRSDL